MFTGWKNTFLLTAEKRHGKRYTKGFTTMEIITALLIVGMVSFTITLTFYFVFFKTRSLRIENQGFNNAAFAMQIINKDLYETIVTPLPGFVPAHLTASGRNDKLRFYGQKAGGVNELSGVNGFRRLTFCSLNSLKFENVFKNAPVQIVYYLDKRTDAGGGLILRRQTNHLPYPETFTPKASDPILIRDIQSIHFVYYDINGNAFYDWDSENPYSGFSTPAMVEVALTAGPPDQSFSLKTIVKLPCRRAASVFEELP